MKDKTTVLVIGNGFDLAHGFPTKYDDFLDFCKDAIATICVNVPSHPLQDIHIIAAPYLKNNIWVDYFLGVKKKNMSLGKNWVDLEEEISDIISHLDHSSSNLDDTVSRTKVDEKNNFQEKYNKIFLAIKKVEETFLPEHNDTFTKTLIISNMRLEELKEHLFKDLQRFILAMDIYLLEVVEKEELKPRKFFNDMKLDLIINFNYTHTYKKLYRKTKPVYHIHGECGRAENNLIFGIDDYWKGEHKDLHTNYAIFKKYIQRIRKRTFVILKEGYQNIERQLARTPNSELIIYGHSLAITDEDILKELLNMNFSKTTVYFLADTDEGQYMANAVALIGKKDFENRVMSGKMEFIKIPDKVNIFVDNKTPTKKKQKELAGAI